MVEKLYKITFNKNSYELNQEYEKLSELEKEKIDNLDIKSSFDHNGVENFYHCYILSTISQIGLYKKILNDNLISYICEEISEDVLNGNINLEKSLEPYIDHTNSLKFDGFIYDTNRWIYDNLNIDIVLDRISDYGIESLRPIDKEFLNDYK